MSASSETTTKSTLLPSQVLQTSSRERLSSVIFDRSRTPPEFECCFGELWPPRIKGWCIWDLRPGRRAYQLWKDHLFCFAMELINNIETDIETDAAIHAWMVGKDANHARPTVVIFSIAEKFRKEARRILKPEMAKHKFAVMTLSIAISRDSRTEVILDRTRPLPTFIYGVPVKIPLQNGKFRCATIGGEICLNDERYGVTVAHVFEKQPEDDKKPEEMLELKFDEYNDDGSSDPESSLNVQQETYAGLNTVSRASIPAIGFLDDPPKVHEVHDWALITLSTGVNGPKRLEDLQQIPAERFWKRAPPTTIAIAMRDDDIWACTGTGNLVRGRGSSSSCALKLKNHQFIEVWTGHSFHNLVPGDCGSWVVDSTGDILFGMLRGTSRQLGLAYFTPAYQIVKDLENMYQTYRVCLPQRSEIRRFDDIISTQPAVGAVPTYSNIYNLSSDSILGPKRNESLQNKDHSTEVPAKTKVQPPGDDSMISSSSSSTQSVSSIAWKPYVENGRTYHRYRAGRHYFPDDEAERDRLDLQYFILSQAMGGKLHFAPITLPKHVLDIGTGTGTWALETGIKYPNAIIEGTDLSPIQPTWIPPNVNFIIDDAEDEWLVPLDQYDFIHTRMMLGSFTDFHTIIAKSFKHLKPGGWMESEELMFLPYCDDSTMPDDWLFRQWTGMLNDASIKADRPLLIASEIKRWYADVGFVDIEEKVFKLPLGDWPKDPQPSRLGKLWQKNLLLGLESLSLAYFTRILGWTKDGLMGYLTKVEDSLVDKNIHAYHNFYVVWGRKPNIPDMSSF